MNVKHLEEEKYLRAEIEGRLDTAALERAVHEMNALMDRYQCRKVLYDLRQVEAALETHEIYYLPRKMREEGGADVKRAVLFPAQSEQDFSFFETVSANQGLNARTFSKEEDALDWLLE